MSTCAGPRLIGRACVRSESFRRHFCNTSLAEVNRTLVWPQLDGWNSKSTSSVVFSWRLHSTQAVGSTTKASAFAWRICVNQLFLSSWEEQHNKNVRSVILGESDRLTILKQYLVCLSGNTSTFSVAIFVWQFYLPVYMTKFAQLLRDKFICWKTGAPIFMWQIKIVTWKIARVYDSSHKMCHVF